MTERNLPHWEQLYSSQKVESMPWYHEKLDEDFAGALGERHISAGKVLDLGTGPGTQAIELAKTGFDVTATDISATAVKKASEKASDLGLKVDFLTDDILESRLQDAFDIIFDRGLFHVLDPDRRPVYAKTIHRLLNPGGMLFLKCFSYKQPGTEGPHRLRPEDIHTCFEPLFEIISITETEFHGTMAVYPKALFCVMSRI